MNAQASLTHCGVPFARYIGPQEFPGEPDLHLWDCAVCHSSVTAADPAKIVEALLFVAGLVVGGKQAPALVPDSIAEAIPEMGIARAALVHVHGGARPVPMAIEHAEVSRG